MGVVSNGSRPRFHRSGADRLSGAAREPRPGRRGRAIHPRGDRPAHGEGDRIEIPSGAVEDFAGNRSLREFITVRRDSVLPRADRVTVTEPVARAASYVELSGFYNRARVSRVLRIEALDDGIAFGAAGNDWEISIEFDEDLDAGDPPLITVNEALQRIDVATSADTDVPSLVDDLNGDSKFNDFFEADLTDHEFADDATIAETLRYVGFVAAPDGNEYIVAGRAACDLTPGVASGTLVARLSSQDVDELPSLRARAFIRAGAAYDLR